MNELIKLLSDKAIEIVANKRTLADGQIERTWRPEYYDQVFAELIVRECAAIASNTNLEDVDGGDSAVLFAAREQILEHFGVKE